MKQHSDHKKVARNTLILYVRQLFLMVVSLVSVRIVLRTLGVNDYGIYNVVGGVVTLFGFFQGSMATGTQRFLNFEMGRENFNRLQKIFSASLIIHAAVAVILFILAETLGLWFVNTQLVIPPDRMVAANWVYQFSIFSAMITVIQTPYTAVIIANEKMDLYGYLGIADGVTKLAILYFLIRIAIDKLILYAVLLLIVGFLFLFVYRYICSRKFIECHFTRPDEKGLFKEMIGFSGWNLIGSLAGLGLGQGQNILLNLFFGPVINATRAIATQVNGAVYQFMGNFMFALNPQITKCYAAGERGQANNLIFRGAKFSFFLIFIFASPILIRTQEILVIWLQTPPEFATVFCQLILIDTLINCVSNPLMTVVQATGRIKNYMLVVGGLLLLNLPIAYVLLKLGYPAVTVYYINVFLSAASFFLRLMMVNRILNFGYKKFLSTVFLRCWLMFIIAIPVEYYISQSFPDSNMYTFLVMLISAAISLMTVFLLGMTKSEQQFFVSTIDSKLNIFRR